MSANRTPSRPSSAGDLRSLFPSDELPFAAWLRRAPVKRAFVVAACAWVPLLLLGAVEWLLDRGTPFPLLLRDTEVHVRFLIAVPLLILARGPISMAIERCVAHFTESKLIEPGDARYATAVKALHDDNRSRFADVAILALAVLGSYSQAAPTGTWGYAAGGQHLNWAGAWHVYVAVPVHQFLLMRWVYRWIDWDLFILRTARMKLNLHATHADRSGGLAFLAQPAIAFALVLFAASSVLAARWSTQLARDPASEAVVRLSLLVYLGLVVFLAFAPLLVHVPRLVQLRRDAILTYGVIAQKASAAFYERWRHRERTGDEFLEANDPCAMIDFASDYQIARSLRVLPIGAPEILTVLFVTLLPLTTLALVNQKVATALEMLIKALL